MILLFQNFLLIFLKKVIDKILDNMILCKKCFGKRWDIKGKNKSFLAEKIPEKFFWNFFEKGIDNLKLS